MRNRLLAGLLGMFVLGTSAIGVYVQYRYVKYLTLRTEAIEQCNKGDRQTAQALIGLAIDYAPDSETLASAITDRRRFRFGFCEDYSGGNF